MFRLQIFHPESGFFINTNHTSDDPAGLNAIVRRNFFAGVRYRIIDDSGNEIPVAGDVQRSNAAPSINDLAEMFGVPVKETPKEE